MGEHVEQDATVDEVDASAEQQEAGHPAEGDHHHGEEILHKLEHGWQHLEDLTGGRAHIELAGEDQESNFEGIEHHENAEHH
ncbi:MAG TPA: hypothetical protein VHV82_18075 [Sporichthyaceae bacterium]|jgi:hypothetical protein|nr:hypothetical protein [Sporichthyaceae bacterium]